jgi:TrmH family RNA methyltransferase
MEQITSRTNALCTHLRKLAADRAYRQKCGEFLCDSPKLLEEALSHGGALHTVVFTPGSALPPLPEGVRQAAVPEELMRSISPAQTPQGVLSVCAIPAQSLPEKLEGSRYLVLDTVQDPGNVGTILRTADALGADGLLLVGACADLYNPKTVRATMGAVFRCPAWRCTVPELRELLRCSELALYGAALRHDTVDARAVSYRRCAIAIGSEGKGLSQEVLDCCDKAVRIPMRAHCESLNAAAAATVLLWEAARGDGEESGVC